MEHHALLENLRLAAASGADPAMLLCVALAGTRPSSLGEAFDWLSRRRRDIESLPARAGALRTLATLEPELRYEPEIARVRPDRSDHEVRGKLLFAELLGKRSFFQVAALSIGGVELSAEDAELLADVGVLTQLTDARIWPLAVTRRVAAHGGGLAHAVVAGVSTFCTSSMAVLPVSGFIRFLDRVTQARRAGESLESILDRVSSSGERIPGLGRPALGPDERVPHQKTLYQRQGRMEGESMKLTLAINAWFAEKKGLRVNSAGMHGALMRDLGFSPDAAAAFCVIYFIVPVLAQAVAGAEHALRSGREAGIDRRSRKYPHPDPPRA